MRQEPRSQQDIDSYRQLVLAAVGFDEQRGDVVSIENVPFYSDAKPEEPLPAVPWYFKRQVVLMPAMKYGSLIILFLLVYFIILRPIRKKAFQALSYAALGPATEGNPLMAASETCGKSASRQRECGGDCRSGFVCKPPQACLQRNPMQRKTACRWKWPATSRSSGN